MKTNKTQTSENNLSRNHKENLSASVLFTFTPRLEYMVDMLQNGISPRYVYERLPGSKKYYIAPMKCFCDIPLGKVKNHMNRYGYYGIGLKKSFLLEHRVTPVIYIHKNSKSFFAYREMKNIKFEDAPFLPLLKRYYGDDYYFEDGLDTPVRKRIHFYNEREWRFIPSSFKLNSIEKIDTIQEGVKLVSQLNFKNPYKDEAIMPSSDEIEYIIIRKKKELDDFIVQLRKVYRDGEFQRILTKIIIADQILKDF
jgi:hypothetical protein